MGDNGKILGTQDIADLINAADTETENRMETREDVWGHESFDIFQTSEYGLCLPATLVEGSPASLEAEDDSLIVPDTEQTSLEQCENIDILQWIVEDQEIDPLSSCEVSPTEQTEEVKRVSVIVPVSSPSTSFYIDTIKEEEEEEEKEVKVKVENLTEDEKYRRMRVQNNDASKRCREKRKRKHQEMEEELEFLQSKNQTLLDKVASMEREVRAMKKRLLTDISCTK